MSTEQGKATKKHIKAYNFQNIIRKGLLWNFGSQGKIWNSKKTLARKNCLYVGQWKSHNWQQGPRGRLRWHRSGGAPFHCETHKPQLLAPCMYVCTNIICIYESSGSITCNLIIKIKYQVCETTSWYSKSSLETGALWTKINTGMFGEKGAAFDARRPCHFTKYVDL